MLSMFSRPIARNARRLLSTTISKVGQQGVPAAVVTQGNKAFPAGAKIPENMTRAGAHGAREVKVESNDYYDGLSDHYYLFQQDWEGMVSKEREAFKEAFFGENIKRVLDPSCGSGEQSMALAGLGLDVVSTDPSGGLVAKCAENAQKLGYAKQVTAMQSDFLNLTKDVEGPFDAIVTKGSSLPHLHTDSDLLQALKNFHALLRPGGIVNIGVRDYDYFIKQKTRVYPRQVLPRAVPPFADLLCTLVALSPPKTARRCGRVVC
eukprot:3252545-Rhodomonas_salina.1